MGRELGRISGPLLADNLKRNGSNLAFDNKVLFLDVVNKRIGFNTATPVTDLYTPTAIDTTNLIVDTTADIGNFVVSGNTIQHVLTNITISPNQAINPSIVTPGLSTDNLYLATNTLSTITTNSSINISPNGSGKINFANDSGTVQLTVNGNLHATGNITWDGNITLGNAPTDSVTFNAEVKSDILPSVDNVDNLGSNPSTGGNQWTTVYTNNIITASTVLPDFTISGNTIAGTVTNGTVNYRGFSGNVNAEYLKFTGNTITNIWPNPNTNSQNSIIFNPNGTGTTLVNSATSIQLPVNNDSFRTLTANGEVRFNDINLNIEGYSNTGYVNFFNLYSQKYNTYITGELTTGLADNILRFAINGAVTATIDSSKLYTNSLTSGNINLTDNAFSNITSGDINLSTTGTGRIKVNGTAFDVGSSGKIINTSNGAYTLSSTGYGHIKFAGSGAVALPYGDNTNYTTNPQTGQTRFNTDLQHSEIYNGTVWLPVKGTATTLSTNQVADEMWRWDIILG